jgi:integrase
MEILHLFPNLFPSARTSIILKQPKTEGSIRNVYLPDTVMKKLLKLRELQQQIHEELGDDGYMSFDLIICQANGRPIMTEHLNKRFKEALRGLADPSIGLDSIVFHNLRHTSASVKLRLSKGDLKAVQGDGGWNTPDMVTKRYAHILDEDRKNLANAMESSFYSPKEKKEPESEVQLDALLQLIQSNPELLKKVAQSVLLANNP